MLTTHAELAAPTWQLSRVRAPTKVALGTSHFGGSLHAPADFQWPRSADGYPLTFIAQLECATVQLAGYPRSGWLAFFATIAQGMITDEQLDYGAVRYFDGAPRTLREHHAPTRFADGRKIPASERDRPRALQGVQATRVKSVPCSEDVIWQARGIKRDRKAKAAWDEAHESSFAIELRYGGHPRIIQNDPRVTLVQAEAANARARLTRAAAIQRAADWRLLLSLEMKHCEIVSYLIPAADLKARRFERARMIVQWD